MVGEFAARLRGSGSQLLLRARGLHDLQDERSSLVPAAAGQSERPPGSSARQYLRASSIIGRH